MAELLDCEQDWQALTLDLITSGNVSWPDAKSLETSLLADRKAEGYPGRRIAAGCEHADAVDRLAIEWLRPLFDRDFVACGDQTVQWAV